MINKYHTFTQTGALMIVIFVLALTGAVWSQDDAYMAAYTGADADGSISGSLGIWTNGDGVWLSSGA